MLDLDIVLFEQMLFNILDNAAKYAPPGSLIQLHARLNDGMIKLEIMDEGEGLPPGTEELAFQKFYHARSADRRRAGTSLGLATCRGFVEAMNGTLRIADVIGPNGIIDELHVGDKTQLLQDLAHRSGVALSWDRRMIFDDLQAREIFGATGFGKGFALPHARLGVLSETFARFVRLSRPIDFGSVDECRVDLVMLLLTPVNNDE